MFDGITNISDPSYADYIYENFIGYLDWAFLNIGAFYSVRQGQSTYGQDQSKLRYVDGYRWESYRKNWVWESGLSYQTQPIKISGVYINSQFYTPAQTGFKINYRDGQIIFTNPLPSSTQINCEYSYKLVGVHSFREPWFKEILFGDWVETFQNFYQVGSGVFNVLAKNRVNTPFVVIEVVPRRTYRGKQLGGGQWVYQDVMFHLGGEQDWIVQTMLDCISFKNDATLNFYNIKTLNETNRYRFNYDGTLNPSGLDYNTMVHNYLWKRIRIKTTYTEHIAGPPLYLANIKMNLEAPFDEI